MSMSQEEIEALMNGLDIAEDEASDVAVEADDLDAVVNEEATALEADSQELATEPEPMPEPIPEPEPVEPAVEEPVAPTKPVAAVESEPVSNDAIDELINSLDVSEPEDEPQSAATVDTDDIDELLASIDGVDETSNEAVESDDIDDLIASLDSVSEEEIQEPVAEEEPVLSPEAVEIPEPIKEEPVQAKPSEDASRTASNMVEEKIQSGVFPLPADDESKVVTQLTAVAEDSEEKATKIFDVLSYILDENMAIDGSVTKLSKFMEEQEKVLQTLTTKFPNVDVFSENLTMLQELKTEPQNIKDRLNNENNELFAAMELMQYHDINRQKIERVMSVIRKLSVYLNNIFEDDNSHKEIAVAKHISGDNNDDLVGAEDLEALIEEYNDK